MNVCYLPTLVSSSFLLRQCLHSEYLKGPFLTQDLGTKCSFLHRNTIPPILIGVNTNPFPQYHHFLKDTIQHSSFFPVKIILPCKILLAALNHKAMFVYLLLPLDWQAPRVMIYLFCSSHTRRFSIHTCWTNIYVRTSQHAQQNKTAYKCPSFEISC